MANLVICAENPVTRAGLAAMATTGSNDVLAQLGSLPALSTWLQTQSVDLVVVEFSKLDESELDQLIQLTDDLFYAGADGSSEEAMFVLLLLNDWRELRQETVSRLSAELLNTGLVSMLPMTVSTHQMRDAIAAILNGLVILHPDITDILFAANAPYFAATTERVADALLEPLTAREIQVLNQLAGGLTNKAIAKACHISEHTVKFHISAIFSKLGVASRTEAVAVSIRRGLVML